MNKRADVLLWNFLLSLSILLICTNLSFAQEKTWKSYENIESRLRFNYPDKYEIDESQTSDGFLFAANLHLANNSEAAEWTIDICVGTGTDWIHNDSSDEATVLTTDVRPVAQVTDYASVIARLHCSSNGRSCRDIEPWRPLTTAHGLKAYEVFLKEDDKTKGPVFAVDISTPDMLHVIYIAPRKKDSKVSTEDLKNIVNSMELLKIKKGD